MKTVGRWVAVAALSVVYYALSCGLLIPGIALTWNSPGPGNASELDHPVTGVILLASGVAVFVFFPRLVKKLTGSDVISTPYRGFTRCDRGGSAVAGFG